MSVFTTGMQVRPNKLLNLSKQGFYFGSLIGDPGFMGPYIIENTVHSEQGVTYSVKRKHCFGCDTIDYAAFLADFIDNSEEEAWTDDDRMGYYENGLINFNQNCLSIHQDYVHFQKMANWWFFFGRKERSEFNLILEPKRFIIMKRDLSKFDSMEMIRKLLAK